MCIDTEAVGPADEAGDVGERCEGPVGRRHQPLALVRPQHLHYACTRSSRMKAARRSAGRARTHLPQFHAQHLVLPPVVLVAEVALEDVGEGDDAAGVLLLVGVVGEVRHALATRVAALCCPGAGEGE